MKNLLLIMICIIICGFCPVKELFNKNYTSKQADSICKVDSLPDIQSWKTCPWKGQYNNRFYQYYYKVDSIIYIARFDKDSIHIIKRINK